MSEPTIDYKLVLEIVNASDDPPRALEAFVLQEREVAAHEATVKNREAYLRKEMEKSQRTGYPWD